MTQELSRTSELAARHTALGSGLEDWNGMGTAWTYNTDPNDEHDAIREAAGLFDMSPLKKVWVRGKQAAEVVDDVITRDMSKIVPGRSAYGAILTERGTVCDDSIISNNGNGEWMVVHGSGDTLDRLNESGAGKSVDIIFDDDLHNVSFQGPKSTELLSPHTPLDLTSLTYFSHAPTELFGHPCRISRTGYSGERGYEIFAYRSVVGSIWDNILTEGQSAGVMPCSFTALDKVRIEAALLFFGYDMTDEHFPWEVGLGFTFNRKKASFRGRDAALAVEGKERFVAAGIVMDHNDAVAGGETLKHNGEDVGVINSPGYSHRLGKSLALVHLRPDAASLGTVLEAVGEETTFQATVETTPFYDPTKSRVRG